MPYCRSIFFLAFLICSNAWAQRTLGYWFIAPGGVSSGGYTSFAIHMGGGAEFALPKGFAFGIEGGALGPRHDFTQNVLGVASLNGYYHFLPSRTARLDPFVTGGYSLFFRHGTANLGNFGGGLNYWFVPHVALRAEFRDHVMGGGGTVHFWGFRFGLSFSSFEP